MSVFALINKCCRSDKDTFEEIKTDVINNFMHYCDLTQCVFAESELERLKESNGRMLIITRTKFRQHVERYFLIQLYLKKVINIREYDLKILAYNDPNCNLETIYETIEACLNIFVQAQMCLLI